MIDGGPLRTSQPSGRRTAYRNESVHYQPEEPQPLESHGSAEAPKRAKRQYQPEPEQAAPKQARNLSWMKWLAIPVVVALLGAALWMMWPVGQRDIATTIDSGKYQAVFLSNGQVYFGKLAVVNNDYMELTNVFYLERQLTADTGSEEDNSRADTSEPTGDNNFQLLKYSDVLYGSEDAMVISKDDIIRFENLRSDGVVAKAIANR